MLGRDAVGDLAGFREVARADERAALRERRGDDVRARHRREPAAHRRLDRVDQRRVGREQDRLRDLVVLGLREEVDRDPVGVRASRRRSRGSRRRRRPCRCRRCRTRAASPPRRRRCPGRRSCRPRGPSRCRRRAPRSPARRRSANARVTPARCAAASTSGLRTPSGVGTTITISRTPATDRRDRVHQHRRRIRRLAAGHVEADAVERRHALAEFGAVRLGEHERAGVRLLRLVERADARRGGDERVALRGGQRVERARIAAARDLERGSAPPRRRGRSGACTRPAPRRRARARPRRSRATAASIAGSCAASKAISASSAASKPRSAESSRRTANALMCRPPSRAPPRRARRPAASRRRA